MQNNLKTTFCVIGDPIGQSLSPEIHSQVFRHLGLPYYYETVHVLPQQLKDFVKETHEKNRPGFNVTIPHKETIIPLLDETDPLSTRIGAVNTVWNQNGKLTGWNTDVFGCITALKKSGWISNGEVVLLGAGGAARGVIEALNTFNVKELVLFDLVKERAERLQSHFHSTLEMKIQICSSAKTDLEDKLKNTDLLINATPVGMTPRPHETPIQDITLLPPTATVFDLVPKPVKTRLLQEASSYGLRTIHGLSMLVAQALAADEIWLQQKLDENLFEEILNHLINQVEENV